MSNRLFSREKEDFDAQFERTRKDMFSLFRWVFGAGLIWFIFSTLLGLTLLGAIIYVAWHFISKVW